MASVLVHGIFTLSLCPGTGKPHHHSVTYQESQNHREIRITPSRAPIGGCGSKPGAYWLLQQQAGRILAVTAASWALIGCYSGKRGGHWPRAGAASADWSFCRTDRPHQLVEGVALRDLVRIGEHGGRLVDSLRRQISGQRSSSDVTKGRRRLPEDEGHPILNK